MDTTQLPVAVIGAGPVGLAAAANLVERNIPFVVFEAGDDVASSIADWAHVRLFSPWAFDIDPASRRLLDASGWDAPADGEHPTGGELIERYLAPLSNEPAIAVNLRLQRRVVAITRDGVDKVRTEGREDAPFVVTTDGPHGVERTHVRAVIDASGTWTSPNPLGADGRFAIGERAASDRITYGIPDALGRDRTRYAGRRVAIVGSGHSAQNAVRDLARLEGTTITWLLRRPDAGQMFGGKADDQLPERGRLGSDAHDLVRAGRVTLESGFRIAEVRPDEHSALLLVDRQGRTAGPFDRIIAATGQRPDLEPLSELRVDVDPSLESARALAPLIDPNVHSCGSVPPHGAAELAHPEPGFYIAGTKSYGRAPTFLLATGYEQVRSIVAELDGDHEAAADVRLVLPETGACSTTREPAEATVGASACCG